jgi:hypothetical protein
LLVENTFRIKIHFPHICLLLFTLFKHSGARASNPGPTQYTRGLGQAKVLQNPTRYTRGLGQAKVLQNPTRYTRGLGQAKILHNPLDILEGWQNYSKIPLDRLGGCHKYTHINISPQIQEYIFTFGECPDYSKSLQVKNLAHPLYPVQDQKAAPCSNR